MTRCTDETSIDIAALKAIGQNLARIGLRARKHPANGTQPSNPAGVLVPTIATNADTGSTVSVAVSQEPFCFATLSATDPRLASAENPAKSQPLKHGGRGSDNQRWGAVAKSDLARRKFLANGVRAVPRCGFGKRLPP
jgi:hypothetical protein